MILSSHRLFGLELEIRRRLATAARDVSRDLQLRDVRAIGRPQANDSFIDRIRSCAASNLLKVRWNLCSETAVTNVTGRPMDETIARLNIDHFHQLLDCDLDEPKRAVILRRLAEEQAKLGAPSR